MVDGVVYSPTSATSRRATSFSSPVLSVTVKVSSSRYSRVSWSFPRVSTVTV